MIDAYKDWCGPCEVMAPTYERIYLDNEECEKRMEFRTVRCPAAAPAVYSASHSGAVTESAAAPLGRR